jgi:hypothetical protein
MKGHDPVMTYDAIGNANRACAGGLVQGGSNFCQDFYATWLAMKINIEVIRSIMFCYYGFGLCMSQNLQNTDFVWNRPFAGKKRR